MVSERRESEHHQHLKIALRGVLFGSGEDHQQGHDQENVDPVHPGRLALLDLTVGQIHVVKEDAGGHDSQHGEKRVGNGAAGKPNVNEERCHDEGVKNVNVRVGIHLLSAEIFWFWCGASFQKNVVSFSDRQQSSLQAVTDAPPPLRGLTFFLFHAQNKIEYNLRVGCL